MNTKPYITNKYSERHDDVVANSVHWPPAIACSRACTNA